MCPPGNFLTVQEIIPPSPNFLVWSMKNTSRIVFFILIECLSASRAVFLDQGNLRFSPGKIVLAFFWDIIGASNAC